MPKIIQTMIILLILTGLCCLITNCSDEGVHPLDVKFVIPATNISFIDHIQPMLEIKCGYGSGCHSTTNIENGLMYTHLVDKNSLMEYRMSSNGEKLVDLDIHENNPQLAPFYLIVREGYKSVVQMPPYLLNREPLNENQIEGIKNWIAEGAQD